MSSKFSTSNNQFAAAYEQQSQPTSALITPLEERRKNRGSGLAYLGKSALAGLGGVLEGAGDLIVGSAALFSGDKAYAQHLFEDDIVGGWKHNNDAIYNPNSVMKFFGEAATGVGQSSVFLVPHVGTALFFTGVTGSGISEAVQTTGDLGVREYAYGALSGGTEAALEALTGAGGQVAKSLYGKTAAKAGTTALVKAGTKASEWAAKSAFLGVAKDMVSSAAGEFVEEFLGDYTDVLWKRVTGVDPEASTTLGEAMYSGLVGAVSGAFMSGTVSTINAARLQSMGRRTINEGNAEATISTARRVVDAFQTSDTSKLPPALAELRQSLAAYDSIADKTSGSAAFNLGRIKADIFYTQAYSGVQQVFDQLEQSSATSAQNIADYMSAQYNKKYTAEDFMKNKDGIRTVYAVEAWAYMYLSDSRAQQDMTAFKSIIDADKTGTAAGEPSAVRSVAEAVSDGVNAWNGSDAVYKAENATESGAQYIKIKKLGEDSYSIAWGSDAERMRGYTSRTAEEVRSILNVIAETDAQVTMGRQAAQEVSGTINSVESTINELQGVIDAGGIGETAEARRESLQNARDELARRQSTLADLKAAREQVNAGQDMQRAGLEGAQQLANMGGGLNTDTSVTYTAAEQDAARKVIGGFDTLHPDVRRSVLEWLRSSQGLDEKLRRSISNIIAARPGLNVLSAELGEGHRGLYSDSLGEGARLVVIDAKQAGDAATDVITHELAHDVEKSEGYAKLKKAAIASTSEARRREIIDMYVTQYEGVQSYTEWLGDRAGTYATWAEYLKAFPQIDGELVTQEIVAKAVGERLGKTGFIEKYASKNVLTRALRSLRSLFRALKADKADGAAQGATVKLGRAFERAMQSTRSGISSGGVRFSIQDGKVVIDTDQDIFDGVAVKDYAKTVREYMREHFRSTEVEGVTFDRTSEGEYAYSRYTRRKYNDQQDGIYDAKMRASTELANIVKTSEYIGHEDAVHPHDYNTNGYDRYNVSFSLDGVKYSGEMLIATNSKGRHIFYDIINIKKEPVSSPPQGGATKGDSLSARDSTDSGESIPQDWQNVKSNNKNNSKKFDIAEEENVNEYRKPITAADTEALREIGRKSVNDFTSEDIKKTRKWAYKFYQELGTKSPFFRAWFGDWRANDTSAVKIAQIQTLDISNAIMERGTFTVDDTGWTVYAGTVLQSETKHYARGERISEKALSSIKEILSNAVLLDTEISSQSSNKKSKWTAFMHKLYTPITYNGRNYIAKIAIEEFYNEGTQSVQRRAYQLQSIKIEPVGGSYVENSTTTPRSDTGSTYRVSQLYDLVKRFDKDFSTSGRASAVSNADGAPRVMYHGTNGGNFTVFDATKSNKRVRLNALGDGYYFTETAEKASRYGERVVDAYLDMKDPYRLYAREGGIRAQMAEDFKLDADSINRHDIQTILKQHGYDGVLLYHSKYDADSDFSTAVVFAPEQIKSASDNIGTFDRTNPDIRYDLAEDTAAKKASKKEAAEAKKKKAAEREAAERKIVREANRIVRKANRESVQAEREEFSERERRQAYSDKYARSVAKGVSDVYEVLSRNTAGRISDKIHEFFNLYDMDTAVEKTQEAIRDSYIRYRINYEKKLAANEAAIEQATKAGTEIPARLPVLPDMAEFNGKVEQAGEYLREAYRRGDISGNIQYSEEKLRRALRKMVAGVKLTDGNGKEIASSATLKRNDQYRVAKRLAEVLTDSQLDANGRRKLFEAVAEYLTDNMVLGKTGLASTIAETMSSKDRLALQILQQSRGRIRDDKVLSDFVKAARRSGDQAAALTSAWLAKPGKKYFGVTPAEVAEMLKIKGIEIDTGSGSSVDIMNSLNSLYNRLYNEYHDIKRQVLEQHGMDVSALATKLETLYTEGGNYTYISKYEQALREYQADAMRKLDEANKKLKDAQAQSREQNQINRLTGQMRSKIERIKKRSEGFKRVGTQTGQDLDMVMKSATRVMRGSTVSARAAIQFANDVLSLLRRSTPEMVALMEAIHAGNDPDGAMLKRYSETVNRLGGESELARIFDDVVDPLLDIAKLGDYKVGEERTTVTAARPLTLDELKTIDTALQRVIDADTRHGRVYVNGEWVDSSSYATELAGTTDKRWRGERSRVDRITLSRAVLETIRPALVFQILEGKSGSDTGVLSRFFGEIEKAAIVKQAEQLDMLKDILDFVNDGVEIDGKKMGGAKYMQHYSKDTVKLTMNVPGRGTAEVLISIGEAMSFSATFRREQARGNFALNAFEFEDNKSQNKAFVGRVAEKIAIDTDEDVDVIMDRLMNQIGRTVAEVEKQLTAEDMALMKLGETFFEKSKQLKMATDMTLYGKTNVISGYYFPLIRSSLSRDANYIDAGAVEFSPSTHNFSWNKRTIKNASGRLVIRDYLRVIEGHADQLATYAYMTIPVQNMQRVLNTRLEVSVNDCGTAREVITREVYSSFDKYVSKLFSDIQGRKRIGNELDAKLESFLGRSFTNVLGLNVQSMLKQFASACLAFGYVSPTSWSRGLMPRNREEMTKYSKAAFIRTNDAALASSHTGLNVSYLAGKTMGTLKLGDMAVTQLMWSMCQCQVEESLGLGIGTVENMTRAGEMLDYLISKCQDTSDATSKSALARTDNRLWQMTTLFRSQVGKTYSELVASAWALYDIHHRRAAGETVADTELKQAQKHAAKLLTGFVMSSVFTATVAALISKLRGNSDDDTAADVIKSMALDTVGDMIGTIPLAGQLMQTLMSGYDAENFYYGVINDGLETVEAVWGLGTKVVTGQTVSSQEAARTIRKSLYLAGQMTGIPVRNVENIVKTVTHTVTPTTFYKYKTLFYSPATADVQKAVASGNERLAETAMRQLMRYSKTGQRSSARVSSELTRLYSAGLTSVVPKSTPTKATIDGEEIALTARQTREFKKVYQQADAVAAELVFSADYAALDDAQKAKALKGIYDIYYSRAGYSVLGRELATASALSYVCDDVPELVTAAAYMSSLKTDDEGKRKDKVYAYIAEYPQDVQSLLWAAAGYKNETASEDIIKKAAQLDESTRGAVLSALKLAEE